MTTINRLCSTVSKRYIQAGAPFKIDVKILLVVVKMIAKIIYEIGV